MEEDRLNSPAVLKCHREVDIDREEVVEEFSHCHPCRMLLVDPFLIRVQHQYMRLLPLLIFYHVSKSHKVVLIFTVKSMFNFMYDK